MKEAFSSRADLYGVSPDHVAGADFAFIARYVEALGTCGRALDISCGAGHTAALLTSWCSDVVALDISYGMLQEAQRRYGSRGIFFVGGDSENLPFRDGSFHLITCRIAPHHFVSVGGFLREVNRVLDPEGCALIVDSTVPPISRIDDFINLMEKLRDPTHVRSLTIFRWRELVGEAGLTVSEEWTFRKRHDFPSWLDRTRPSKDAREAVVKHLCEAPEEIRVFLDLERDGDGNIVSYEDEKTIFVLRKGAK